MRLPITIFLVFTALTIAVTGFWESVAESIFPSTVWGLYSRSFFENVLVEAHGTIVDLFVVGVLLYWFQKRQSTEEEILRNQEILGDLRYYRAPDGSFRTLGSVRRLLELGVTKLHLSEMAFNDLEIKDLQLKECNLHAVVFTNSRLQHVVFDACNCDAAIFAGSKLEHVTAHRSSFRRAKFQDATLKGINFTSCQIEAANFTNANLRSANFRGVDCRDVNFNNADLRSANFIGAQHLTCQMLAVAKSIQALKSDDPKIQALVAAA